MSITAHVVGAPFFTHGVTVEVTLAAVDVTYRGRDLGRVILLTAPGVRPERWSPDAPDATLGTETRKQDAIRALVEHALAAHAEAMGL